MGLKELGLIGEVFPDPGLRPMGDIDLLIHPEDYEAAAACMKAMGFVPLPRADIPYTLKYAWGHHFRHPDGDVWVDLQWNIMQIEWDTVQEGNFNFEIERVWAGAHTTEVGGGKMLIAGLEDMLFHLCLHWEGHHYQELVLGCEIAEFLKRWHAQIDWPRFVQLVKKFRVESSVYYPLLLAQRFFQAPVEASAFDALRPAYLKTGLIGALHSNLTNLHISLDEINFTVHPAPREMRLFEQVVRQQASGAMHLYRELDGLACAFHHAGGTYIALQGAPSERRFPDLSLEPFRPITVIILKDDLPRLEQALSTCGFSSGQSEPGGPVQKMLQITSRDPILRDRPIPLSIRCKTGGGLTELWHAKGQLTSRQVAMKTVRASLPGAKQTDAERWKIDVSVTVLPLSLEEILIFLAARAGENSVERLYHLMGLIDLLQRVPDFDWAAVLRQAEGYGMRAEVEKGLAILEALFGQGEVSRAETIRIFQWARLGPDSTDEDASFKPLYFYVLNGLACPGALEKSAYFLQSLWGGKNRPFLPGLLWKALAGRLRYKASPADTRLAYWLDPQTMAEIQ